MNEDDLSSETKHSLALSIQLYHRANFLGASGDKEREYGIFSTTTKKCKTEEKRRVPGIRKSPLAPSTSQTKYVVQQGKFC